MSHREKQLAEIHSARQSSADLLDLVRSAEEAATLATETSDVEPPSEPVEEFVDVGDEAIDAPPSLPPGKAATPAAAFRRVTPGAAFRRASLPADVESSERPSRVRVTPAPPARSTAALPAKPAVATSPLVAIALPLALAIVALIAVTR